MKKNTKYIDLEYTSKDIDYIEELISYINDNSEEIINFFDMDNFGANVNVKLFDNLEEFRTECREIRTNKEIPSWLCGLSFYANNKFNIYTLCLDEYQKTKGHNNCSLADLKCLIMHEFVHACHQKYTNNTKLPVWLSEGLATTISRQYDDNEVLFTSSLEQMINGGADYKCYYTMFSYVLDRYGKDYILDLLKNVEMLKKETPKLYEEFNLHIKMRADRKIKERNWKYE